MMKSIPRWVKVVGSLVLIAASNWTAYQFGWIKGRYSTETMRLMDTLELYGRYYAVDAAEALRAGDPKTALGLLDRYILAGVKSFAQQYENMPEMRGWLEHDRFYRKMNDYAQKNRLTVDARPKMPR